MDRFENGGASGRRARLLASVVVALAAVAAPVWAQPAAAPVPVYDATQLPFDRYTVVRRLSVESRESAYRIRGHRDLASARAALASEAARIGADGVLNVTCFDQTDWLFNPAGYVCYGNAIRIKNERRVN